MNLKCLFGFHAWLKIVERYRPDPIQPLGVEVSTFKCVRCGKIKVV